MKSSVRNGLGALGAVTLLAIILMVHTSHKTNNIIMIEDNSGIEDLGDIEIVTGQPKDLQVSLGRSL